MEVGGHLKEKERRWTSQESLSHYPKKIAEGYQTNLQNGTIGMMCGVIANKTNGSFGGSILLALCQTKLSLVNNNKMRQYHWNFKIYNRLISMNEISPVTWEKNYKYIFSDE